MHLDTHVVVWLHTGDTARLPAAVRRVLDSEPLVVSPIVGLELDLLYEVGRTTGPGAEVLTNLSRVINLAVSRLPFAEVTAAATALTWTRDPFDRLICAQARAEGAQLLTRDRRILANFDLARWD